MYFSFSKAVLISRGARECLLYQDESRPIAMKNLKLTLDKSNVSISDTKRSEFARPLEKWFKVASVCVPHVLCVSVAGRPLFVQRKLLEVSLKTSETGTRFLAAASGFCHKATTGSGCEENELKRGICLQCSVAKFSEVRMQQVAAQQEF